MEKTYKVSLIRPGTMTLFLTKDGQGFDSLGANIGLWPYEEAIKRAVKYLKSKTASKMRHLDLFIVQADEDPDVVDGVKVTRKGCDKATRKAYEEAHGIAEPEPAPSETAPTGKAAEGGSGGTGERDTAEPGDDAPEETSPTGGAPDETSPEGTDPEATSPTGGVPEETSPVSSPEEGEAPECSPLPGDDYEAVPMDTEPFDAAGAVVGPAVSAEAEEREQEARPLDMRVKGVLIRGESMLSHPDLPDISDFVDTVRSFCSYYESLAAYIAIADRTISECDRIAQDLSHLLEVARPEEADALAVSFVRILKDCREKRRVAKDYKELCELLRSTRMDAAPVIDKLDAMKDRRYSPRFNYELSDIFRGDFTESRNDGGKA